jgi:hypothetical protein
MKVTAGGKDTVGDMQRVVQSIPASYTIWKDGTQTIAESNIKGGTDYTTGTDVVVIQNAIDALTEGGTIFVRSGIYELTATPTISTDGISIIGEGSGRNQTYFLSPPDPLARLTKGTVFKVTAASTNAIAITGRRFGVNLAHFGIDFTQAVTGHGISCAAATGNIGLSQFEFDDIFVNDLSTDKYALYIESPCLGSIRHFTGYGAGLFDIVLTDTAAAGAQFNCGNINFDDCFGWTTKAMTVSPLRTRRAGALAAGTLGLSQFNRLQLNCDDDLGAVPAVLLYNAQFITFHMLDLEVPSDYAVSLGGCSDITFVEPLAVYSDYWHVFTDCNNIQVFGGAIYAAVMDRCVTDRYFGTWMLSVDALNVAKLIGCKITAGQLPTENSGTSAITAAATSVVVTHGCGFTPAAKDVTIVQTATTTNPCYITYVDTFTPTEFTVHCNTVPGASTLPFAWAVRYV